MINTLPDKMKEKELSATSWVTCADRPPAMPARKPEMMYIITSRRSTGTPRRRMRTGFSRTPRMVRPKGELTTTLQTANTSRRTIAAYQ